MNSYEKINAIFDEELKTRIGEICSEYAEIISKKHGIALDLLLRDIPTVYTGNMCKGTKSGGIRCTHRGIHNGYCGKHVSQGERIRQRVWDHTNIRTSSPDIIDSTKGLIDLRSILTNE
jgi:uncharacterized Fe-S cluster-containing protein